MCHILASSHPILFPCFLVLDNFSSPIIFELVSLLFVACLLIIPTPTLFQIFKIFLLTVVHTLWAESSKTTLQILFIGMYRHSNYDTTISFSMGNPLTYGPLMLCWQLFVVKPDITLCCQHLLCYVRGCNTLCENKKKQFRICKTRVATFALYLEAIYKWPTDLHRYNLFLQPLRGKNQASTFIQQGCACKWGKQHVVKPGTSVCVCVSIYLCTYLCMYVCPYLWVKIWSGKSTSSKVK